ncbi:MAG: flagellar biosynthesis protein FlhF [Bacillota bacterium]
MKVKRYVGETAQEALQKVKSDLGRDAIILNTRKIRRKGIAGFFSKPLVEVVATIDSDVTANRKSPNEAKPTPQQARAEAAVDSYNATAPKTSIETEALNAISFKNELSNMQLQKPVQQSSGIYGQNGAYVQSGTQQTQTLQPQNKPVSQEQTPAHAIDAVKSLEIKSYKEDNSSISEIKNMLNKVYDAVKIDYENNRLSEISRSYLKKLEDNEVDKVIINDIKEDIIELLSIEKQQNENIVRSAIYDILNKYIKDPEPFIPSKNKKVILFIGPTGVGKTTTLAKLAANMVINEKRKVGLITSDTYRIAAVEQLKTYSEIIGVPLSIIYTPAEITNTINGYKDKDIVLVDTAGRSHKDQYQLMELKSLLKYSIDNEVYLLISATTKFSDCIEIIKSYSFLDNYKLLFTKLDETSTLGVLLNVAYITKKPISYITTGQSVPDDIEVADKNKIINCLLGDNLYERSS